MNATFMNTRFKHYTGKQPIFNRHQLPSQVTQLTNELFVNVLIPRR